jgi:hypothetical protein
MSLITKQGKQYLIDKKKTYRRVSPNLNLIEGFDNKQPESAVNERNLTEMKQLEDMQNSYNTLMSKWSEQYKIVLNHVKNPQMKQCVKHCLTENNIDKRSACLLGCSTGKFANSSVDQRITDPENPPDAISEGDTAAAAAAALAAGGFLNPFSAIIGMEAGQVADSMQHKEDDITPTNRPPANTTLVENFNNRDDKGATNVATAAVDADLGVETTSPGGFNVKMGATVNAPKTYYNGGEFDLGIPDGVMGTYGPDGYDGVGKKTSGDMINRYLASKPGYGEQYYYDKNTGQGGNIVEEKDAYGYSTNPIGLRSLGTSAMTSLVIQISQNLGSQPLVKQMEVTNVDKEVLDNYLNEMRMTWKNMLTASCKSGIGGFGRTGPFNGVDTKKFAGNTQHCSAWVNTAENRSGYSFNKKGKPFTVNSSGDKKDFNLNTIPLNNVAPYGCDTPIPGERVDDFFVGGAGYCKCEDGREFYADAGHPPFTCNAVCAPENKNLSPLLYHNSKVWEAPAGFAYGKWVLGNPIADDDGDNYVDGGCPSGYTLERHDGEEYQGDICKNKDGAITSPLGCDYVPDKAPYSIYYDGILGPKPCRVKSDAAEEITKQGGDISKDTTGRLCGTFSKSMVNSGWHNYEDDFTTTYNAINNPPACPTGMVQDGKVKLSNDCKSKNVNTKIRGFFENPNLQFDSTGVSKGYERRCKYAAPPGFEKPMVNNISKIKPLPSQDELLETCSSVPYESMYIDLLELNLLGYLLEQKAAIIYKTIKESYSGSRAAALKNSAVGKKILKNMKIYESAYKKLQREKSKKGIMSALFEDVSLKKGSVNISYYIWLTLAIGGTALALRKFNS